MENPNFNLSHEFEEESIDIKKEISYYFFFWPWFVAAIIIAFSATYVYLRFTDKIYQTTAQIQIKKTKSDPASFLAGDLGLLGSSSRVSVENDIAVITSHYILSQVVERLNLQTSIYSEGTINTRLENNRKLPFKIQFKKLNPFRDWQLKVYNNEVFISADTISYTIKQNEILDNDFFYFQPKNSLFLKNSSYQITFSSINKAVILLSYNLKVSPGSESTRGELVNLSITGTNIGRNEDILKTLIEIIKEDQVIDKRKVSEVSIKFIDQRLKILNKSIDTISDNTINYQIDNKIFDPVAQTSNALNNIIIGQQETFALGVQLEIANALLEQLEAQSNYEILPANVGINNESVNSLMGNYNLVVTQRNNLLVSAPEQSPIIMQINRQLQQSKTAIIKGVKQHIESLKISVKSYQQLENQTRGLVASLPNKEKTLRRYARNFKIVEELYVFLLQRREEALINYESALPNLKVLSSGVSSGIPIAPKGKILYLGALFIGLLAPFGILFLIKIMDTKINTREDLEKGLKGINILGEIPFDENYKVDTDDSRGVTAESIRVLRSNLSFLLKKDTANIITVTSTIKGEGKSFVSYNLAKSYKALGKKVILIGGDLRNPQLHKLIGIEREAHGLSTYLSDQNFKNIDNLIMKGTGPQEIDLLLSGAIPPNPSELLMSSQLKNLLELLKERYDVILIDSAPLLLVSDTTALLPISDLLVYVSRSQFSDKNTFPFIKELRKQPNMPPLGMVLNGLISNANSAYKYGYSYRYNYTYKYNYGYGYGYGYGSDK